VVRVRVGVGVREGVGVRVGGGSRARSPKTVASMETRLSSVSSRTRLVVSPPFLLVKVTGSSALTTTAHTSTLESSGVASTEAIEPKL